MDQSELGIKSYKVRFENMSGKNNQTLFNCFEKRETETVTSNIVEQR